MLTSRISSCSNRSSTAMNMGSSKISIASAKLMPSLRMLSWFPVSSHRGCRTYFLIVLKKARPNRMLSMAPVSGLDESGILHLAAEA